ncbi:MAG: hypothetical protein N4A45_10355 [Flavobacteriales bacterium]|jgi:hypothetical protein|nr:hypothetical protein [Flavobacteriales bacterium]
MLNTETYFQGIAEQLGWGFVYGSRDKQNLLASAMDDINDLFTKDREVDFMMFCRRYRSVGDKVEIELILGFSHAPNYDKFKINQDFVVPSEQNYYEKLLPILRDSGEVTTKTVYDMINEHDKNVSGVFVSLEIDHYDIKC